ncbi:Phosphoglycerate mutase [Puccinia graminis f. sp. tritici]|uniref:Phosphoglycerate mutase n=2 Tax=Puccinia graminis f. sp. tritici TaxID=56615 RepID=E3KE71_PUCGT|nr:2,3-bisphosphoglycerate-dependent phosphoglycerate mutase [Puccinia graminis f. sp. tritici CRL 75-36-700-3]EFP82809.1 2,3-bisphosphoglycerate-dependent phosphoglycerate mutase [Puccinia graminis f. sp. tritici CRL 75-36-700-3]KAA1090085.1 Phosphoglycerate mutase [Puccinia graminis f. sp. tritici]
MSNSNNVVVLIRHGQSEWNEKNLFTGFKDPELTSKGREEAKLAAERLKKLGFVFDCAYTSALRRAQVTLDIVLEALDQKSIPIEKDQALNERDYGDLSGLNKDDARKKWGEEQVHIWRRSYDVPPPNGESLEMTAQRTLPYYNSQIKPKVLAGKKVLVAAHGNSLRSIIMQLEGLSGEEIVKKELDTGVPIIYELDSEGKVLKCTVINS